MLFGLSHVEKAKVCDTLFGKLESIISELRKQEKMCSKGEKDGGDGSENEDGRGHASDKDDTLFDLLRDLF